MNRRGFFRNLVLGLASAPAVAKLMAEKPVFEVVNLHPDGRVEPVRVISPLSDLHAQLLRHVAETNPYSRLLK